ncbi:MAG: type II toxin-antitoxin system HicB family antitoxin [Candidatus Dormibacteria bacterium]
MNRTNAPRLASVKRGYPVRRACQSSIGRITMSPSSRGSLARLVGITNSYTDGMSKIMVSIPDELLRDIDDEARRRSMSRSALLAAAARRELVRRDPAAVAEAIARSEQRFRAAGGFDAAELVRQDRDARR